MNEQVLRNVFQKSTDPTLDLKEDNSSIPVYMPEISKSVEQYMRKGSLEASQRALTLATSLQMAGRTSEPAWVTLDSLHFDPHYMGVFGNAPQSKTSKMKVCRLLFIGLFICDPFSVSLTFIIL